MTAHTPYPAQITLNCGPVSAIDLARASPARGCTAC
jgi:hypothetical protein